MPRGNYIAMVHRGGEFFSEDEIAFIAESLNSAIVDARNTEDVFGPTMVYCRDAMAWQNENAPDKFINEWIDERIIKGWYYHLLDWLFAGVYSVCFDDLIHNFDLTMKGIEQRFSLQRKADTFAFPSQKIGWSPSTPDDQPRIWNEESLALYDKIVDWDLILELSSLKGDIND